MQRLASCACLIALMLSTWAPCDGWKHSAEARLTCCADSTCPMHRSTAPGGATATHHTQADADQCCAASEQPTPTASATAFVPPAILTLAADTIPTPPSLRPFADPVSRTGTPATVPRHVLLSVFLV